MTSPLPELSEATLDEATVNTLLADLAAHAEVLDLLAKGGANDRAADGGIALSEVAEALARRSVRGVQIRYRFDGAEWRDTLLCHPNGVRLVRMRMPALPPEV